MILEQELKWICEYLKIKNTKKNICEDYLDKKYIDSLGFLKFILAIEKKFKIKFNNSHFLKRDYRTPFGLSKIIKKIKKNSD
jgi:acyl carrier protein